MLEERKSRKVGQTFSKLASTELHNANYSMQPNLSKIDFSIEKLRQLFVSTSSHCLVFPCQLITFDQLFGVYFPIIRQERMRLMDGREELSLWSLRQFGNFMPYFKQPFFYKHKCVLHLYPWIGRWMRGKEKYLDPWPASLSKTFTRGLRFRLDHIFQW